MTTLTGPYGTAQRAPAGRDNPTWPANLDTWIITAPAYHPLWTQYGLSVVSLADFPGQPAAVKHRPGVTHELLVLALNPDNGPYRADGDLTGLSYLTPVNICEQFTATDEQARQLAELCARAVVDGVLTPETADAPDRIRAEWRASIRQTLDHDRDPRHGRAN